MAKGLVVCADDFGMSEGVSRGIVELAEAGRVSATSCMTNAPGWPSLGRGLCGLEGRIGIGLHLTLTWGRPLGPMPRLAPRGALPPLRALVRGALTGRLPIQDVEAEIDRQVDAFAGATGREPDFVDGHQHVHALPGVRDALVRVLARRGLSGRVWLRDPSDRRSSILRRGSRGKALLLAALSAGFRAGAVRSGFRTNEGFSGFSAFAPGADLAAEFAGCLARLGPRPLLMCHPGHVDDGAGLDEVVEAREAELAFLSSPRWIDMLAAHDLKLVPAPA